MCCVVAGRLLQDALLDLSASLRLDEGGVAGPGAGHLSPHEEVVHIDTTSTANSQDRSSGSSQHTGGGSGKLGTSMNTGGSVIVGDSGSGGGGSSSSDAAQKKGNVSSSPPNSSHPLFSIDI
jgi:hypothetical protein